MFRLVPGIHVPTLPKQVGNASFVQPLLFAHAAFRASRPLRGLRALGFGVGFQVDSFPESGYVVIPWVRDGLSEMAHYRACFGISIFQLLPVLILGPRHLVLRLLILVVIVWRRSSSSSSSSSTDHWNHSKTNPRHTCFLAICPREMATPILLLCIPIASG